MATEKEICEAIMSRKSIVYTYNKEGYAVGERYGEPHLLFRANNGRIVLHLWKTGGVHTQSNNTPPCFRPYHLPNMQLVKICDETFAPKVERMKPLETNLRNAICSVWTD